MKTLNELIDHFDKLFNITHFNAMNIIEIKLDKLFLNSQKRNGHPGSLTGVELLYRKEKKQYLRLEEFEKNMHTRVVWEFRKY